MTKKLIWITILLTGVTLFAGPESGDGKFINKGVFYYFTINHQHGGFLTNSRINVRVNSDRLDFMDAYYTKMMEFSGVSQSIINDWLKLGKNHIQVIIPTASIDKKTKPDSCYFEMHIEKLSQGDFVDTQNPRNIIFEKEFGIGPADLKDSILYDGYFEIKK